ncbi:MAG TPA: hypothetical protein VD908_09375 [Cytophagales bacterium]|nr:hypothetical protein [Cytophagales bacterium]
MINEVLKYLTVYFFSTWKFVGGPLSGYFSGLSILETSIFTVLGMMTTVLIISFVGRKIRATFFSKRKKKLFTKKNRKVVFVWKRYGLPGVAFLTPVIFSPIIGASVAASFGERPGKIFFYMFFSAIFWSLALSLFFFKVGYLFRL